MPRLPRGRGGGCALPGAGASPGPSAPPRSCVGPRSLGERGAPGFSRTADPVRKNPKGTPARSDRGCRVSHALSRHMFPKKNIFLAQIPQTNIPGLTWLKPLQIDGLAQSETAEYCLCRNQTMAKNESEKIRVSKLDAARRQLDCAVELWFAEKDEVSIHTLAAAAHQIIHDINKKRGVADLFFDSIVIRDEYRAEFVALVKRDMNFFKHADKDVEGITEFVPLGSILFMLFSAVGLQQLGERLNDVEDIFILWLAFHHPNWINEAYRKTFEQAVPVQHLDDILGLSKQEFFTGFLCASAELRAKELA